MSAIKESQKENASKFMNEFWTLLVKPYYNPEESDAWWTDALTRMSQIGDKYCQNDRRLMQILLGFEKGLEEVHRNERGRS